MRALRVKIYNFNDASSIYVAKPVILNDGKLFTYKSLSRRVQATKDFFFSAENNSFIVARYVHRVLVKISRTKRKESIGRRVLSGSLGVSIR